ncbi:GNAT family N-acetyltransferase [Streptomyces gobiensis]|uniref:GNAT family N-acetyltransferase n=1 Tax=Streptomyces gobiensis TaxID=2875706 RepID=UPI001E646A9F|nr:GNAT family N-acetyltransferase [Streptomyces gobiensis]UGY92876.1 GNAT family N-acetyltransferase [Streptomyces gobiensis]
MSQTIRTQTIRTLSDPADIPGWLRAVSTGFLDAKQASHQELTPQEAAGRLEGFELSRTQGAYDGDRCVATFRTFPQELTVPGGATLPATAVTQVTVTATHRRRGLLTQMMGNALAAAKERGDACANLIAAEYPIYGRYGFGPATWTTDFEVDIPRAGLNRHVASDTGGGRIDVVEAGDVRKSGPACYERFRALPTGAGVVDRGEHRWRKLTGDLRFPGDGWQQRFFALYRDAEDTVQGLAAYSAEDLWEGKVTKVPVTVHQLTAATAAAERSLWHYLLSLDWAVTLRSGGRAPDDVLPLLLGDPRMARITSHGDHLWLRPLDVPMMLKSRSYAASGTLVLDLHDEAGLAGGRFRLDASPEGATCTPSSANADLSMEIGELGALFLGDEAVTRLSALGRITEHRPGAAALADTLLRTARRPWCPDTF